LLTKKIFSANYFGFAEREFSARGGGVPMSFEYIKHILSESQEVMIKIGCVICVGIFIADIVRNKISEFTSGGKNKK